MIGALLSKQQFSWEPYLRGPQTEVQTISEWVHRFEADYFTRCDRNPKSETTWQKDYHAVLKRLPAEAELSEAILRSCITNTKPNTKNRKRTCFVLRTFARFAEIDLDLAGLSGSYSPRKAAPRDLPTDEVIVEWRDKIANSAWRWVYSILAAYGLRPHEAFNLDLESLKEEPGILSVLDGKTGARRVFPLYPEWWHQWKLYEPILPKVSGPNNAEFGHRTAVQFNRIGIPFKPYDLRHAWAVRAIHFGWDLSMASAQMGHSVSIHTDLFTTKHNQRIKIVPRYLQYRGVYKAINRLLTGQTKAQHGTDDQRGGILWHYQGSGKSFDMVFILRKLRTTEALQRFKVVIVTDRTDLEDQLSNTLLS